MKTFGLFPQQLNQRKTIHRHFISFNSQRFTCWLTYFRWKDEGVLSEKLKGGECYLFPFKKYSSSIQYSLSFLYYLSYSSSFKELKIKIKVEIYFLFENISHTIFIKQAGKISNFFLTPHKFHKCV